MPHEDVARGPITVTSATGVGLTPDRVAQIDGIFFAASVTRHFPDEATRAAFREQWLGRYLARFPGDTLLALDAGNHVVGYLVGARDDPAGDRGFADIGYFAPLSDLTAAYPAHLHINLAPSVRSRGIGARLVEMFCARLREEGIGGVHVVTAADARNRSFYDRLGFAPLRTLDWKGAAIVMLGRRLRR